MDLGGIRVLVTRPAHQAQSLCAAIQAAGGHPLQQPLLSIRPPGDTQAAAQGLQRATTADAVIFTSVNALDGTLQLLPQWRPQGQVYAVGRATSAAVQKRLAVDVLTPSQDYSSEGLLALASLQRPAGLRFAIISGEGGREFLLQSLRERGAAAEKIAVYRRENISVSAARITALLGEADAVFISSPQSLEHLYRITPASAMPVLLALQLVVSSSRVVKRALEMGFSCPPLCPARMQDDAILATLSAWVRQTKPGI